MDDQAQKYFMCNAQCGMTCSHGYDIDISFLHNVENNRSTVIIGMLKAFDEILKATTKSEKI
jgi:hypothetical protein